MRADHPRVTHPFATRVPVQALAFPFDLHVLSTPPAFILSQDQTLHKKIRKKRAVKSPKPDKQKTDKKNSKVQNNALQATCHRQKPSFGPKAQGGQPPPAHTNTTSRHTTQAVPADKPQETHHKKYINTLSSSHTTQAHQDQHPFEGDDPRKLGSTEVNTVADFRQPRVNPRYPPPSRDPVTGQHLTW